MEDKKFTFMFEAYKAYIEYYRSYIDGMWVRFNTLLTINTALVGVYGTTFTSTPIVSNLGMYLFPILGLMASFLLYAQSAQERYILTKLRANINEIRDKIQKDFKFEKIPALFAPLDEIDEGKTRFVYENIVRWRSCDISITQLPAIVSLIFIILWILIICIPPILSKCGVI